jgi:hypothetical protein
MTDAPLTIKFTVSLSNGHFESTIQAPFPLTEPDKIITQWLATMETGLRIGAETMRVEFPNEEPQP